MLLKYLNIKTSFIADKKRLLIFLILLGFSLCSRAQLHYTPQGLLILGDVTPYFYYTTRFEGEGVDFSFENYFLKFYLGNAYPEIAGAGNQVVFYNTETSTFDSIQVASVTNYSDRRAKTNIASVNDGLQTVMKLKPVAYDWKKSTHDLQILEAGGSRSNIGFISQDVEQVLPQLVYTDFEGKKLLNYIGIIPVLIKSMQELSARAKALEKEIAELERSTRR